MPRKEGKAVPEGNDPVPQQEEFGSGHSTLVDVYRMIEKLFDKSDRRLEKLLNEMRRMDQRLASLEHDARHPRLAMVADGQSDTKTPERTKGAARAVQSMHGDSLFVNRVDPDPMCSTTFGVKVKPPALPCMDDGLVEKGAAAPKSRLSLLEMRSPTAAGGLLFASMTTTTAIRTAFHQPPSWFCLTEGTNWRTSIIYVSCFSSFG